MEVSPSPSRVNSHQLIFTVTSINNRLPYNTCNTYGTQRELIVQLAYLYSTCNTYGTQLTTNLALTLTFGCEESDAAAFDADFEATGSDP
jgi:hypothetical protein